MQRRASPGRRSICLFWKRLTACLSADRPGVPTWRGRRGRGRAIVGGGSRGRDVDGGAPGAARAGPEGGGGGVRGGGDRGVVGAGGPGGRWAGGARPGAGGGRRSGAWSARSRGTCGWAALARAAGRLPTLADRVDGLI